ncbi:MAG: hypothetical protein Fur0044_29270 [Anaerolineae bacterium]|nr:hypothetical protein [Anaerolineales bacterium]MCQ3974590.1 hypothetical protein [Anaerolineae bacterium]
MITQNDNPRFLQLIKALDAGWEIDQPVLIRSTWRTASEASGTYHFVLRRKAQDQTTLLSLPPSPELLAFLANHKISITTF